MDILIRYINNYLKNNKINKYKKLNIKYEIILNIVNYCVKNDKIFIYDNVDIITYINNQINDNNIDDNNNYIIFNKKDKQYDILYEYNSIELVVIPFKIVKILKNNISYYKIIWKVNCVYKNNIDKKEEDNNYKKLLEKINNMNID